jgi:glycerol-3-phosphate dehydrogenase
MAEDCVDHAVLLAKLEDRPCVTKTLQIYGYHPHAEQFGELRYYGADAGALLALVKATPELGQQLHPALPILAVQVLWAAREEMARKVDDVLSRRTRALFLNAQAAIAMAPAVARLMAGELGRDERWQKEEVEQFRELAQTYNVSHG